jgi:hypothetical protein
VRHYPQGAVDIPDFEGEVPPEVREVWVSLGGRWRGYEESKVEETQKYLQEREWARVRMSEEREYEGEVIKGTQVPSGRGRLVERDLIIGNTTMYEGWFVGGL